MEAAMLANGNVLPVMVFIKQQRVRWLSAALSEMLGVNFRLLNAGCTGAVL